MSLDAAINKALGEFAKKEAQVFAATVTAVNEAKKTVSIKDVDDLEFFDVRLAAAEDDEKSILLIPKVGSSVLAAMIGNDINTLFVAKVNEVEKVVGAISTTEFEVDSSGYKINRDGENLKSVLNDFLDEVNKIRVIYGNTINVAAVTAIKGRLNKILK